MPSGSTSTCALQEVVGAGVLGDAHGDRCARAGPPRRPPRRAPTLVAKSSTSITFSGHTTRSTGPASGPGGGQVALEDHPRVGVVGTGALRAAALHQRPPGSCRPGGPGASDRGDSRSTAVAPTSTPDRQPPPAARGRHRDAEADGDQREEQRAAEPGQRGQRPGGLADGERGQGHALEGEGEPRGLDQRDGGRQAEPAPATARSHRRGHAEEEPVHARRQTRSRARSGTTSTPCPEQPAHAEEPRPERGVTATAGRPAAGRARRSRRRRGATNPTGAGPGQRELRHRGWRRPQRGSGGPTSWRRHVRRWPSRGGGAWPIAPTVLQPTTWSGADPSCSRLPRSCSDARRRTGHAHRLLRG